MINRVIILINKSWLVWKKKNHIVNFSLINLFEIRFQIIKKKSSF